MSIAGETKLIDSRNEIAGNINTSFLKVLALVFMFIDHLGASLYPGVMELRIIGRMAFPLYAWCLVVGCVKTRSPLKYAGRLLLVAVVSQPLYMMALNHTWKDMNILFTLSIALAAIQAIRLQKWGSQFWGPVLCYMLLIWLKVDYGWKGLTFILLLYLARENRKGLCAAYLAYALFWGSSSAAVKSIFGYKLPFLHTAGIGEALSAFFRLQGMVWLSLPLIAGKTKVDLKLPKWLGYALYPLHLILLIVIKLMNGTEFAFLFRGF